MFQNELPFSQRSTDANSKKLYNCSYCSKCYSSKPGLWKHTEKMHKSPKLNTKQSNSSEHEQDTNDSADLNEKDGTYQVGDFRIY